MTLAGEPARLALLRRGFSLEYATLAWNVIGIVVLAIAAVAARSVALAFGPGLADRDRGRRRGVLGPVRCRGRVLQTESRVTLIDGILATAVLAGLVMNAALGWWWADPGRRTHAGLLRRPRSTGPLQDRRRPARYCVR